jgi:glyoxylase-like metal-dependent hydrolase (beta-lactamase superfamily II)/pimeloyl-ACP methyl ester carboxylesterase
VKLFTKICGFGLLLLLAVLLILLLPAHLQVREVEPPLPSEQSLRAMLELENTPTRVSFVNTSSQHSEAGVLGHNSVLIEWANGDIVMIDAGMDEAEAIEFGKLMEFSLGADKPEIHGTIAQLLGEDIERVKAVGFTHLHIDHAQGIVNFCEARIEAASVLQTTYQRDMHNYNTSESATLVAESCLTREVVEGDGLMSFDQFPGLALYPLGGHTPGSTLFAVADGARLLLFSGDITNRKADIVDDQPKSLLYSYLLVPENTDRTAVLRDWLRELDQQEDIEVVVSHDLQNMQTVLPAFDSVQADATQSYTSRWNNFQTRLILKEKSFQKEPALQTLQDTYQRVEYISDGMSLEALLNNRNIVPGQPKPALVYLHGGFGLRYGAMTVTQPFTDAGYIVLAPSWRGENSNAGYFECFMGEVRDAKAAIRWLAQQDYVDPTQIYVFGWSVGGGIALNLALQDDIPVRLSASSAGVYDTDLIKSWATEDDYIKFPYDYLDEQENYFRLPLYHLEDMARPHYTYIGVEDGYPFVRGLYDELYPDNDTQLRLVELPGDHMDSLPTAVQEFLRVISSDGDEVSD